MFRPPSAPDCQERLRREEYEPLLDEARYLFLDDVVVAIGDNTCTLIVDVPGSHFPVAMFHWTLSVSATGRPMCVHSELGASATGTGRSKSRSMTFVATLAPPSRHNRVAVQIPVAPTPQLWHTQEKTATTTGTHREGERRKTETAQQDHPQPWARSGSATRLGRARQGVPSSDLLPTVPRLTGLVIINFVGWWSSPSHQSFHEGTSKPSTPVNSRAALEAACKDGDSQSSTPLSCRTIIVATSGCLSQNHGQTVSPAGPKSASRRPIPPMARGRDAVAFAVPSAPTLVGMMRAKHLHNPALWPSAKSWTNSGLTTRNM